MASTQHTSIKERIKNADSATEIQAALEEGGSYLEASPKTKKQWRKLARRRMEELNR